MDKQMIYDIVRDHLMSQGRRSEANRNDLGMSCAYRGTDGAMCAVGCLIADEVYSPAMEGSNIHSAIVLGGVAESLGIPVDHVLDRFLYELQNIHDNTEVKHWAEELYALAVDNGLCP